MRELKNLIGKREIVRAEEAELTRLIIAERARESKERRQNVIEESVPYGKYIQLKKDYVVLREMNAVLARANGQTYKKIGEMFGVSASRASQLVARGNRRIKRWNSETQESD